MLGPLERKKFAGGRRPGEKLPSVKKLKRIAGTLKKAAVKWHKKKLTGQPIVRENNTTNIQRILEREKKGVEGSFPDQEERET